MKNSGILTSCITAAAVAAVAGTFALAQPTKDAVKPASGKPAAQPAKNDPTKPAQPAKQGDHGTPQLPPGWTEADMMACVEAGTPGKMQEHLAAGAGTWNGKTTMWMAPGADPVTTDSVSTVKMIMDGRYAECEWKSDMPGMGPFHGRGIYAYDNTAQKFQSTWIDNHSSGIMMGTGELSADGKVLTWNFTFTCPINKKPTTMREVETITGPNTRTMEMFGVDPKSGKEYKMMAVELTRKG
jgi:hypothetical protein